MKDDEPGGALSLSEELFRKAEDMAHSYTQAEGYAASTGRAAPPASDDVWLYGALRELEQLALRRRFLPEEILTDRGWLILLDLFASELQPSHIELNGSGDRWGFSEPTATRQLAALISRGLVQLRPHTVITHEKIVRLTDHGRSIIRQILAIHL